MRTSPIPVAGVLLALAAPAWAGPTAKSSTAPPAAPAAATKAGGQAAVAGPLRFIADDGPAALAEAKRRGVPVFVEAWAPW